MTRLEVLQTGEVEDIVNLLSQFDNEEISEMEEELCLECEHNYSYEETEFCECRDWTDDGFCKPHHVRGWKQRLKDWLEEEDDS